MQTLAAPISQARLSLPARSRVTLRRRATVCSTKRPVDDGPKTMHKLAAAPLAAAVAAALLLGAASPEEALAARSGGRVGGSVSRSAPRASTSRNTTVVNNTTVVAAPPVFGGFGYSPFGFGGGYSFMPSFFLPFPLFGGFFQIILAMMVVSFVFTVASSAFNKNKDNDVY